MTIPARERATRPAVTRLAWALCALSVALALASVALAVFNGEDLLEQVAAHHAIGILDALVLSVVGALIVVRDRRHLLAWLLLVDSLLLATFNFAAQYALCSGMPRYASAEPTCTTAPRLRGSIRSSAAFVP